VGVGDTRREDVYAIALDPFDPIPKFSDGFALVRRYDDVVDHVALCKPVGVHREYVARIMPLAADEEQCFRNHESCRVSSQL